MKTRKESIFLGPYLFLLGISSALFALAMVTYTWDKDLSVLEISLVVGFFSTAVSLILFALDCRKQEQRQVQ